MCCIYCIIIFYLAFDSIIAHVDILHGSWQDCDCETNQTRHSFRKYVPTALVCVHVLKVYDDIIAVYFKNINLHIYIAGVSAVCKLLSPHIKHVIQLRADHHSLIPVPVHVNTVDLTKPDTMNSINNSSNSNSNSKAKDNAGVTWKLINDVVEL